MSITIYQKPQTLENTEQAIFFEKQSVIYADEDYSVKPPPYGTVEKLIESIKTFGPLICVAKVGPSAYSEPCFKLKNLIAGKEVWAGKPGSAKEYAPQVSAMILGVRKVEEKAYVYFTLAKDITQNTTSLVRAFKPLDNDSKIYVMSFDNFLQRALVDLHPVCPYGDWLFSQVSLNSILDKGAVEKQCNEVGQKIFDHYKYSGNSISSERAINAVKRICQAASGVCQDGKLRGQYIEYAWDGIGDDTWKWRC